MLITDSNYNSELLKKDFPWAVLYCCKLMSGFISNFSQCTAVNWWLLAPIQMPTGTPVWCAVKNETLFGANKPIVKQHSCGTGRRPWGKAPWGEPPFWLDSSALRCAAPRALLHSGSARHLQCFSSSGGNSLQALVERESALSEPEGSWLT